MLYNIGLFIGLPIAFYINGLLVNKINFKYLYGVGILCKSLINLIFVILGIVNNPVILVFGLIYGFFNGLFWANRNYITLKSTNKNNRVFFTSTEYNIETILSLFIPLLIGWFITLGAKYEVYSKDFAYIIIMFIGFILAAISIKFIFQTDLELKLRPKYLGIKAETDWQIIRMYRILRGIFDGFVMFFPTLIILYFLKEEGILGTLESASTLLIVVLTFLIGKANKIEQRHKIYAAQAGMFILDTIFLLIFFNPISIILFKLIIVINKPFHAIAFGPIYMNSIDKKPEYNSFAYIADSELMLNIGRIIGILIIILVILFTNERSALRYAPALLTIMQIPLIFLYVHLNRKYRSLLVD